MRAVVLSVICFFVVLSSYGQTVQGFVLNKDTRQRLAKVYIYNGTSDEGIYNNARGEFTISAKPGDILFAALEGYAFDTVVYKGQSAVYFQLKPIAIQIEQVDIERDRITPRERLEQNQRDYGYSIERGRVKDVFTISPRGAGISIDAIYNLLSRQGKNARRLQEILERDYKESIIDYRYRADVVGRMLQIKDPELKDFMQQYRPTYTFVLTASDYTFALFLKNSYASYKRMPDAFRLPELPKIN